MKILRLFGNWAFALFLVLVAMVVILLGALSGCKTSKVLQEKTVSSVKAVDLVDDCKEEAVNTKVNTESDHYELHSDEPIIGKTGGGDAELKLKPVETQPVTDAAGNKTDRTFTADNGAMHAKATVHPDGSMDIQCKMDSVLAVIGRMKKDSVSDAAFRDSLMGSLVIANHSEIKETDSTSMQMVVKAETKGFMGQVRDGLLYVFALFGLIVAARFAVKYVIKYIKYRTLPWS